MLVLPGEPQLTASPRAHAASRDSYLAALGCRDVTDGASGGSAEPQGARSASSRGSVSVCIVYIYPYHGYTGPGPVTGASRGRRDALGDPGSVEHYQGLKGVKDKAVPLRRRRVGV